MSLFVGIDLGSTTSKSILLDEQERIVGKGITNTRANYDVAVEVARREAIADALLGRCTPAVGAHAKKLVTAFRLTQDLGRLDRLRAACRRVAKDLAGPDARVAPAIDSLFGRLVDQGEAIFAPDAAGQGSFFRDVIAARFYNLVDEVCAAGNLDYDRMTGVFDRAMMETENQVGDEGFLALYAAALARVPMMPAERDAALGAAEQTASHPPEIAALVGTGYGRQRLPFPKENIRSEILCHGLGAHALFPKTRTVLDIGGQDTKAIQIDERGLVTGFQMNDRCAAGCGRYLGYIADEMNLGLHELGPLALQATKPCRITSTCTVFAGIELRDLLSVGEKRENVLGGLHRAIVMRALSLLARSGGVSEELTFTGGVARNPAIVNHLRELVSRHYGARTINIHTDSFYTGALGAALFARRGLAVADVDMKEKECTECLA